MPEPRFNLPCSSKAHDLVRKELELFDFLPQNYLGTLKINFMINEMLSMMN